MRKRRRKMQKIKELLGKIGASTQLQEALVKELEAFTKLTEEKYEKLFKERKEKAVKICTEEVEAYKRELAQKVAVFLESKQAQIGRSVEKQLATESSEASDKLVRVKAVVEGVKLNDGGAVTVENKQLQERLVALEQANARLIAERDQVAKRATRAQAIATDVLKQNRVLEAKLTEKPVVAEQKPAETKPAENVVVEGKPAEKPVEEKEETKETVVEGKKEEKPVVTEEIVAADLLALRKEPEVAKVDAKGKAIVSSIDAIAAQL
jgi:hypothetical protein